MTPSIIPVWLLTVTLDTVGQLAFKSSAAVPESGAGTGVARWRRIAARPALWLGIVCYGCEFLAWTAFLSLVPLGEGVLLGSINIVAITLAGRVLFRERLMPMHAAGIALVGVGVAVVGLGT
ncbi:MAG: EamA family transporter [Luteimonas sp.]